MAIDKSKLTGVSSVYPLKVSPYEQYMGDFENPSVVSKINSMIQTLLQMGRLTNQTVTQWNNVMEWIVNGGMDEIATDITTEKVEVALTEVMRMLDVALNSGLKDLATDVADKKISELLASGQFESMISKSLVEINEVVEGKLEGFAEQLADTGVNVKTFGAIGDGVTDDSIAVQNAIDKCATNGVALFFPKGVYLTKLLINMKSGTRLIGESPQKSIIKPTADNLDGRALSFRALGTSTVKMTDISIENIAFDTSAGSRVGVEHVRGFTMRNTRFFGHAGLRMDLTDDFTITDTNMHDCMYGISLMTCTKGTIKNTTSMRLSEVVDFFNSDTVLVDGIVASDYTGINIDEVVDLGSCRNITIQNIIAEGFHNGIKIKTEGTVAKAPANILVANCTFLECAKHGVEIEIKGGVQRPPNALGDIIISNLIVESTVAGARGIAINRKDEDAQPFGKISMENITIKVPNYGFSTQTLEPTRPLVGTISIKNSKIVSTESVAIYLNNTPGFSADGTFSQSLINAAILANNTHGVALSKCEIKDSIQGIRAVNSVGWTFDNCIINGVNGHGMQFDVTTALLKYSPMLTVVNTEIANYGKTENYKSAIAFTSTIPAETTAPFSGFRLQGNRITGVAGTNTHYGIGFSTNGENFKNVIIKDNVSDTINAFMINAVIAKVDATKSVIADNFTTLKEA